MQPDQMLPSTPMTGPTPARRTLSGAPPQKPQQPQQQQSPEAQMAMDEYVPPAHPDVLDTESNVPTFAVQLIRRRMSPGYGPRRL